MEFWPLQMEEEGRGFKIALNNFIKIISPTADIICYKYTLL